MDTKQPTRSDATPPAPGRAEEPTSDEMRAASEYASGNRNAWKVGEAFLAGIAYERRRPAPAIVAEVGEIEAIRARCLRVDEREESKAGLMQDREDLLSAYDAALRTLAEVRGKCDMYERELEADIEAFKERDRVLENASTRMRELTAERDAATQRAEQAERERDAANHLANEWADVATNGLQWLKNVADGTSTCSKAITDMGREIQRVRAALPAPATNATGSSHNQE